MKILLIIPEYPPNHIGGGGIVFKNLANTYQSLGHEVLIISGDHTEKNIFLKLKKEIIDNGKIIRIPELYTPIKLLNSVMPIPFWYEGKIKKIIKEFSPDFIHIHGYGLFMPAQLGKICKKIGKKYTFTIHGAPVSPDKMGNPIISIAYKFYHKFYGFPLLKGAHKITAVSKYAKDFEIFKNYVKDIRIIGNGINPEEYYKVKQNIFLEKGIKRTSKTRIILSLGRIEWIKGFDKIIDLMPELINKGYDLQYVIAGRDNGEKENLQKKAQDLGITDKIHYLGFIDKEEKLSALTHADIIAIPSETESYGLVALEGRAYGKNIVTTFAGGLQDALDGYNGAYKIEEIEDALKGKEIPDKKISDFYWEEIGKKYLLKI